MPKQPTLTFVATSRNDDHGGDVLRRTQSFIDRLAEQCERHQVSAELIMVEWNPPPSRASLADVLGWPRGSKWFRARLLTVPRRLHLEHKYGSRLSLYQMIAKNVGIRRAAGDYSIATNIDIIFSDELFKWFKRGEFREGVLYCSDRWDIPNEIQLEPDLDVLLGRARSEAIRQNRTDGTYIKRGDSFVNSTPNRFDDAFYNPLKYHLEDFRKRLAQPGRLPRDELLRRYDEIISEEMPRLRRNHFIPLLHTNGCGDFTMLSRKDWARLRGYPEWHIFSWTIDSVFIFQAFYNGLEIQELDKDCVHYHIEHDYGSGWTPEGAGSLWARMDQRGIPYMTYTQFTELVYELQDNAENDVFTIYNESDWGLVSRGVERRDMVAEDSAARPPLKGNTAPLNEEFFDSLKPLELGLPLDRAFRPTEGASVAFAADDGGVFEFSVETSLQRWSYAIELDLSALADQIVEYWLMMEVKVETGSIGIALLNPERQDFVSEQFLAAGDGNWQTVIHAVKDSAGVSEMIVRNTTPDNASARFRVRRFRILTDWEPGDDLPSAELAAEPPVEAETIDEEPIPANDDYDDDPVWEDAPILAAFEAGGEGAVVRMFATPDDEEGSSCDQTLVVTPAEHGAPGAVLRLPAVSTNAAVSLDLQVISGEAGIGIWSSEIDRILAEQRASQGNPLSRIDLSVSDDQDSAALVIRNLSHKGPAKVLVHSVTYRQPTG